MPLQSLSGNLTQLKEESVSFKKENRKQQQHGKKNIQLVCNIKMHNISIIVISYEKKRVKLEIKYLK